MTYLQVITNWRGFQLYIQTTVKIEDEPVRFESNISWKLCQYTSPLEFPFIKIAYNKVKVSSLLKRYAMKKQAYRGRGLVSRISDFDTLACPR
jgi:hypothetical protein